VERWKWRNNDPGPCSLVDGTVAVRTALPPGGGKRQKKEKVGENPGREGGVRREHVKWLCAGEKKSISWNEKLSTGKKDRGGEVKVY